MGLDMYLIQIDPDGGEAKEVGYWRKANQIHNWFVEQVQGGLDECQQADVTYEQLMELKNTCEEVLNDHKKAATLLPRCQGCFFGGDEYDEYYFQDLQDTVNILKELDADGNYYYQSSW